MEEEDGVKAPVTRLRRRLSVELSDDTKSPSAPSTPTKKRGGRLAAIKPQLELINEDVIQSSPKRAARKSIARDVTQTEDNPVTPARRSTRVKSNTSLVSEPDDKVLTPAKRNSRVKSNTSIILESTAVVESPRAVRAALRRNSQAGSDTEASLTPARTRRTRKTSTSSTDKEVESSQPEKPTTLIKEIISEEPEQKSHDPISNSEPESVKNKDDSPTLRKSPRLANKGRKSRSRKSATHEDNVENTQDLKEHKKYKTKGQKSDSPNNETDLLSISSADLIKNLNPVPKSRTSDKNKSTSDIENSDSKSKRHRTKSWTTLCVTPQNEGKFYSDNESSKKKLKKHGKMFNDKKIAGTGSGDGHIEQEDEDMEIVFNTSKKNRKGQKNSFVFESNESIIEAPKQADISNESDKENLHGIAPLRKDLSTSDLFEKGPSSDIQSVVIMEDSDSNTDCKGKQKTKKSVDVVDNEDQCVPVVLYSNDNLIIPSDPSVFTMNLGDQVTSNASCEPMDIDETMPENVSLTEYSGEEKLKNTEEERSRKSSLSTAQEESPLKSKNKSSISDVLENSARDHSTVLKYPNDQLSPSKRSRKSSLGLPQEGSPFKSERKSSHSTSEIFEKTENKNQGLVSPIKTSDKSQSKLSRKSILNSQEADSFSKESPNISKGESLLKQDFDKSGNENKSTLILSEIKDISEAENDISNTPQVYLEMSKSTNISETRKDGPVNKNLILDYLTSTPVQQKNAEKLSLQMNTSEISPTYINKQASKKEIITEKDIPVVSQSSIKEPSEEDSDGSDDENSRNLFIDEAKDVGDDYESGDSQDEDERQYEIDNEIKEKGETLTSEEELSNDSEYEKDSFIVSSDEEDYELLSGSGDDLNMSADELTMSSKSKKNFNERKTKQQKKASKEMFEARHGLNTETKSKKSNRLRLDSTLLESAEENIVPPKKNKRMRLESTLDTSQSKSDSEEKPNNKDEDVKEIFVHKKKKTKRLSESLCNESAFNEKEMTFNTDDAGEDDPLLIKVKPEPKTPQKELEISTIEFTHNENFEEVDVDENASMMKQNDTSDPLLATIVQNDESNSDDESSISENEEITNNYDTMLKELNANSNSQIKLHYTSLNFEKKTKKAKQAIVDKLNLTQTKKLKKNKDKSQESNEKAVKRMFKKLADADDASSDSIDLKLLFSDDSNDSDDVMKKETAERFIPLKRTEGKTDIPGSADTNSDVLDGSLNASIKNKNKKRKSSSDAAITTADDNADSEAVPFFFDTKGDLPDSESSVNIPLDTNSKNKNKNNSIVRFEPLNDTGNDATIDSDSDGAPVEVSYVSKKNKKSNKKLSETAVNNTSLPSAEPFVPKTPESEKKKKKKLSESQETISLEQQNVSLASGKKMKLSFEVADSEVSINKTSDKKKKSKKLSESKESNETLVPEITLLTPTSDKKKKVLESQENQMQIPDSEVSIHKTSGGKKKSKKLSESKKSHETSLHEATPADTKKKVLESVIIDAGTNITLDNTALSEHVEKVGLCREKKRKRKSSANITIKEILPEAINVNQSLVGNKTKKIKLSKSIEVQIEAPLNISQPTATEEHEHISKKKTNNKNIQTVVQPEPKIKKKRKERDDDETSKISKVLKENSFDKIHVQRLPSNIIKQLEEKPRKEVLEKKKANVISTVDFVVEEKITKRSKPSHFLEETVYLNNEDYGAEVKKKAKAEKPKVLPFLPTVSTADSGFTTNFQVNVIHKVEFVGQRQEVPNFKNDYLHNRRIKKLRTYDLYKKHRNVKLSKF